MEKMKNILVVDDDAIIGVMLKDILNFKGYEVTVLQNPANAEKTIQKKKIDLVLLDMLISGVNGTDVCTRLKNNMDTSDVPILMMSAHHEAAPICLRAGADAFLSKPFNMDVLLKKIDDISLSYSAKQA